MTGQAAKGIVYIDIDICHPRHHLLCIGPVLMGTRSAALSPYDLTGEQVMLVSSP